MGNGKFRKRVYVNFMGNQGGGGKGRGAPPPSEL